MLDGPADAQPENSSSPDIIILQYSFNINTPISLDS
tara:strand:- start:885 stop:992 length:108 start_codon:yes stop_codon:yes gene_type:complete